MAAYAALVSLINLMEDIQTHPCLINSTFLHNHLNQITSLADFLLHFILSYDSMPHRASKELETQISSAAHAAEDAIESHIVVILLNHKTSINQTAGLHKVMEEMVHLKEKLIKVAEDKGFPNKRSKLNTPQAAASSSTSPRKNKMVGAEDELLKLMDELTRQQSSRRIVSVVGMGGIGKTTLAQTVYEDKAIVRHFDFRAWATISQHYHVQDILLQLLSTKGDSSSTATAYGLLGEQLHKKLWGRRYLIVLDDMWSSEVWDRMKFFFPDNANGSRIVVTTRLSNMSISFTSLSLVMKFLDERKSWELFYQNAFCPRELEEIGKKIVKRCGGLPLPLVVIGRHLGKSSSMKDYWESVADDVNSILDSRDHDGQQCLQILSLSYHHLPTHLKPCLLYMGVFREDEVIYVPYLINLWVAEGFLKPSKSQSLEEIAMDYVKDLVDRNLMIVHKWDPCGRIRFVKCHDILRELCINIAEKEKFFCVWDPLRTIHGDGELVRRVVVHEKKHHDHDDQDQMILNNALQLHASSHSQVVRSLQWERCGRVLSSDFMLLKVANKVEVVLNDACLESSFQQVNLRYIDCKFVRPKAKHASASPSFQSLHIPPSISLLWNLQTLIIGGSYRKIIAPSEIWEMRQLKHLDVSRVHLPIPGPPPPDHHHHRHHHVLHKLHRLSTVEDFRLSEDVCERIPNVKKLHLRYSDQEATPYYYCLHNLDRLSKLESLRCFISGQSWSRDIAKSLSFPSSLRELALLNARLRWEDVTAMIGSLPHLVDLALMNSAFGEKWETVEGRFPSLKLVRIYGCSDLVWWNAERSHFPVLGSLELGGAEKLKEIPPGIGEIATLQCIKLQSCSESAAISAVRIVAEQEELGNEDIQLHVHFRKEEEAARFREMVEEKGLACSNLRVV